MKTIIIGDLHGSPKWKQILDREHESDQFIFMGDYFDSREGYNTEDCMENFIELIEKKKKDNRIILLWGNHDLLYYLWNTSLFGKVYWDDYDEDNAQKIKNVFSENYNLLTPVYQFKNYLFTHAGITDSFMNKYLKCDEELLQETIKEAFINIYENDFLLNNSHYRGGRDDFAGPFWAHKTETRQDPIKFKQIIGHTNSFPPEVGHNTYIDSLRGDYYAVIEKNKVGIREL